jgi:ethylbenzene hydroxylase subunit beta/complex iron-sulfur molybdoenzyme family reductase subunit beta
MRFAGYLDDPEGPIYKLVKEWKVAIPLHPEYGTEPNIYYVPPLAPPRFDENGELDESQPRIPDEYLVSLFGPVVHDALATLKAEMDKTRGGGESELMDLLISRKWIDMFKPFQRDPATIEWTGRS